LAGKKFDGGKPKLSLIPPEALMALGRVLTMGAEKYGARNWEQGLEADRLIDAMLRHLVAWQFGEGTDPESGESHLAHVLCNAAFLVTLEERDAFVGGEKVEGCPDCEHRGRVDAQPGDCSTFNDPRLSTRLSVQGLAYCPCGRCREYYGLE